MTTQVAVVYPSTTSFSGTGQLNLGPYLVPTVNTLLRAEVRGAFNFAGQSVTDTVDVANVTLWAVQWVPHGNPPNDAVTSADGDLNGWLIRQQSSNNDVSVAWAPNTDTAAFLAGLTLKADWAGQLKLAGESIDLYLSMIAPSGASVPTMNLYATLRFWWL